MSDSQFRTYEATREAARIIVKQLAKIGQLKDDSRATAIEPGGHQLHHGLCLERASDGLLRLWTLWGEWDFCRCGIKQHEPWPPFPRLELNPYGKPDTGRGPKGTARIFTIHQAGHLVLPFPHERPLDQYIQTPDAHRIWREMGLRFRDQSRDD